MLGVIQMLLYRGQRARQQELPGVALNVCWLSGRHTSQTQYSQDFVTQGEALDPCRTVSSLL